MYITTIGMACHKNVLKRKFLSQKTTIKQASLYSAKSRLVLPKPGILQMIIYTTIFLMRLFFI